ncbi:hypothetical protein ACFX2A_038869 [Malus domestica]
MSAIGDWRDRFANCAALLGAVHEDQRGKLPLRGVHILRGDSQQRVLQGGHVSGPELGQQAAPQLLNQLRVLVDEAFEIQYCSRLSSCSSRQSSGSLFTIFLTAPVQAFCLLLGISRSLTLTTVRGAFSGRTAVPSTCSSPHATGRPNAIIDSTPVAALRQTPAHLLLLRCENNSRSSSTPCGNFLPPLQLHRRPMSRCSRACPHPYPPHLRSETNARNLFNQMPHKDLVTWTALISGYSQHDRPQDALVLFPEMLRQGLEPNQFTLSSLLKASGAVSDNNHGRQLHTYCFKYGLDSKCLCGHCSCGHVC